MTTNQERALALLNDLAERGDDDAVSTVDAVHELAAANLLAPDLPMLPMLPRLHGLWAVGRLEVGIDTDTWDHSGSIFITDTTCIVDDAIEEISPTVARGLAMCLIAAADEVEGDRD